MSFFSGIMNDKKGATLIEIIIAITIVGILTLIVFSAFSPANSREALDKKTVLALSLLSQARNQTLSAKGALAYGVHFETTKAVLFNGPTYSSSVSSNVVEPMGNLVQISDISLSGGGSDVVFNRLTGETSQSGTITLSLIASSTQTKTVTIFGTGISQSN